MMSDFTTFYGRLYKDDEGEPLQPFPYQRYFTEKLLGDSLPNCLNVPTGCGKESTIISSFCWQWQQQKRWRRLAYCLPVRTLVDQVAENTINALRSAGLYLEESAEDVNDNKFAVSVLKGGAEAAPKWRERPDQPSILIGTQDQLLSRALNAGYTLSPYQWPIDFGLVSQDTLWAFDETQLMGAGLDTSIQLQGLRDRFHHFCPIRSQFPPTHSIWLSATLDESRLQTADYQYPLQAVSLDMNEPEKDSEIDILNRRLTAKKALCSWQAPNEKKPWEGVAQEAIAALERGNVLIVVNQVPRAQEIAKVLDKENVPYQLVHSRFREDDRPKVKDLKEFAGIIVATQAIEAGVDLDAKTLFTELCPWSSLVQRVGRCNRRGKFDDAVVYWLDVKDKDALPYEVSELQTCRAVLEQTDEIGIAAIKHLKKQHKLEPKRKYTPIPFEKHLLELFHTDEDLQGSRTNVSLWVRGLQDTDVQIGWREFVSVKNKPNSESDTTKGQLQPNTTKGQLQPNTTKGQLQPNTTKGQLQPDTARGQLQPDTARGQLRREELCRVSIGKAKAFLTSLKTQEEGKTKKQQAYIWNWTRERYDPIQADSIRPGMTILLPCSAGGYSPKFGFTGDRKDKPEDLKEIEAIAHESAADDNTSNKKEWVKGWVTLRQHSEDVARYCQTFAPLLPESLQEQFVKAGRWHDYGKAHPEWQCAVDGETEEIYAKIDRWKGIGRHGLRHELASMLAARKKGESVLVQYLILCHHGKVRTCIEPWPTERDFVRGIGKGDSIKREVDLGEGLLVKPQTFENLEKVAYWNGEWTEDVAQLLDDYGPFALAYMEALLRMADWQASRYPGGVGPDVPPPKPSQPEPSQDVPPPKPSHYD